MKKILMVYDPKNKKYYLRRVASTIQDLDADHLIYRCDDFLGLAGGYSDLNMATAAFRALIEFQR